MAAAFFLREHVDFRLEVLVGLHRTGLGEHLTALDVVLFDTAEKETDVVAGAAFVEQLAEHFDVGDRGFHGIAEADDFDFFHLLDDSAFDPAGDHGSAAFDGEHVFDRHEERLIDGALWKRDVGVDAFHQFEDVRLVGSVAFKGLEGRSLGDGDFVAREVVLAEQVADFHFDEVEQFLVIHHVHFVHEHDEGGNADLTGEQDVLTGLGHWTVSSGNHEDGSVHLGGSRDHVLDVVGVTGAVDVSVVPIFGFVLDVGGIDRDAAGFFFRGGVDVRVALGLGEALFGEGGGDGGGQSGFAMVDVTDGADVDVWFIPLKGILGHGAI